MMEDFREDEVHLQVKENHNDLLNQLLLIENYYEMLQDNDLVQLILHMHLVDHFLLPKIEHNS
jgi:hypothetical protein